MIKYYLRSVKDAAIREVDSVKPGVWVMATEPTQDQLARIAEECDLDVSLLGDALDIHEVPRIEIDEETIYIFTRVPIPMGGQSTTPFLIVVGKNNIVTVSPVATNFLDKIFSNTAEFITTKKIKCVIQLFFIIISRYESALTKIQRKVRYEQVKLQHARTDTIIQFLEYEYTLNDHLSALVPMSSIITNLLSGKNLPLYEEDHELIEDVGLSVGQIIESARANLKTITNVRESYAIIMTTKLNNTIRLLTSLTVLFTIPTMVTSFFGMNVLLPLQDEPFAWVIITAGIVIGVGVLLWLFKRQEWIS